MISLQDRLAGGVWGHLVGDALGVPYEFGSPRRPGDVRFGASGSHNQPPGTWSDDGGLMLALLDSLLTAGFDLEDQGRRALSWYRGPDYKPGGVLFDFGGTTSRALRRVERGTPAGSAGGREETDNGNGSLMRILPIALVDRDADAATLVDHAMRASGLTHSHPQSRVTCALYTLIARDLLHGAGDRRTTLGLKVKELAALLDTEDRAALRLLMDFPRRTGGGYVLDCFWSAWDAFAKADTYESAVVSAVCYGNDTDTTACVAGGLAGIYFGANSIPARWLDQMRGAEMVKSLQQTLVASVHDSPELEKPTSSRRG